MKKLSLAALALAVLIPLAVWAQAQVQLVGQDSTGYLRAVLVDTDGHLATVATVVSTQSATNEVLVQTSCTTITATVTTRRGVELQNAGPNTIYCRLGACPSGVKGGREIAADGTWAFDAPYGTPIYCLAATATQVTGEATWVSEL